MKRVFIVLKAYFTKIKIKTTRFFSARRTRRKRLIVKKPAPTLVKVHKTSLTYKKRIQKTNKLDNAKQQAWKRNYSDSSPKDQSLPEIQKYIWLKHLNKIGNESIFYQSPKRSLPVKPLCHKKSTFITLNFTKNKWQFLNLKVKIISFIQTILVQPITQHDNLPASKILQKRLNKPPIDNCDRPDKLLINNCKPDKCFDRNDYPKPSKDSKKNSDDLLKNFEQALKQSYNERKTSGLVEKKTNEKINDLLREVIKFPNQSDDQGNTALIYAAKYASFKVVKKILDTPKTDMDQKNIYNKNALDISFENNDSEETIKNDIENIKSRLLATAIYYRKPISDKIKEDPPIANAMKLIEDLNKIPKKEKSPNHYKFSRHRFPPIPPFARRQEIFNNLTTPISK